jgi:hypothetical protein
MHCKQQSRDEGNGVPARFARQDSAEYQKQEHGYACMKQQIQKVVPEWPVAMQFIVHRESCKGDGPKNGADFVCLEELLARRLRDLGISEDVQLIVHREAIEE